MLITEYGYTWCADMSLDRPCRRQATFPVFYGTYRFITTFTTAHRLSLSNPNQCIPLPIRVLRVAACLGPGQPKDLSAPRYQFFLHIQSANFSSNFINNPVIRQHIQGNTWEWIKHKNSPQLTSRWNKHRTRIESSFVKYKGKGKGKDLSSVLK